jgi:dipeptidyl aminopeptidase/acylaminoacyl peptidase
LYGWALRCGISIFTGFLLPSAANAQRTVASVRYHFKQDVEGYLKDNEHTVFFLWDVATKKLDRLTTDTKFDEENGVWSPDGTKIAYVSNHDADPDRSINTDVFVVDAKPNSTPKKLTDYDGPDGGRLAWSPDSKWIAFERGDVLKLWQYSEDKLGIVAADGSAPARIVEDSGGKDAGGGERGSHQSSQRDLVYDGGIVAQLDVQLAALGTRHGQDIARKAIGSTPPE